MHEDPSADPTAERTVDLESFEAQAAQTTRFRLIDAGSPDLSKNQVKFLRGLGQPLQPLVMIGARGPVLSIVPALEEQLHAHELVKVKAHDTANLSIEAVALWLRAETNAQIVHILGHTVLFYKARTKKRIIQLPK